ALFFSVFSISALDSARKSLSAAAMLREPQDCCSPPQKCIMAGMFDWNDLKYFLAVARHCSTIAAGKALGTSQSTVHRRLEQPERRIGQPLVTRQASGYRLTEYGATLLPYAERIEIGRAHV